MKKPNTDTSALISVIADELGVSLDAFKRVKDLPDFPKADADRKYDKEAVCRFVISHTAKKGKLCTACERWLSSNHARLKKQMREAEKAEAKEETATVSRTEKVQDEAEQPKPRVISTLFSDQLQLFRDAVRDCAIAYRQAIADGDAVMQAALLKNWGSAFEQLRKAEESIIEIDKARGALLPADEVKTAFVQICGNIRSNLLLLPSKLSHELLNQSSPKAVQDILDDEIRNILDGLSRNPFQDR